MVCLYECICVMYAMFYAYMVLFGMSVGVCMCMCAIFYVWYCGIPEIICVCVRCYVQAEIWVLESCK